MSIFLLDIQQQFEALLAPILSAAFALAVQMTRNRDDAEDVVQEAAVRAFSAFHTFQPGTNFRAWFFKILTNVFLQRHRRRTREPERAHLDDASELYLYVQSARAGHRGSEGDPEARVLEKLDTEQVLEAMAQLPEEFRLVCALYFVEGFAYQEIAEMAKCPVGTVRSRLHRARRMLQKALWNIAETRGLVGQAGTEIE